MPRRARRTTCCWAPTRAASRATGARPAVLRTEAGAEAVGLPGDERFVGMLYLGHPRQTAEATERAPVEDYATFLD